MFIEERTGACKEVLRLVVNRLCDGLRYKKRSKLSASLIPLGYILENQLATNLHESKNHFNHIHECSLALV